MFKLSAVALAIGIAAPALAAGTVAPAPVASPSATPSAAPNATAKYSTENTDIGTLIDDPAAKAILDKYIPGLSSSDQIDMARSMTLKSIQTYAPDMITDERLKGIDSEFAKLPK